MLTRLLLLSLLLLSPRGLLLAEPMNGQVKKISGDAVLVAPGGKPQVMTTDTVIPPGSKIVTKEGANVIIEWLPGAYSILFPNSSVAVGVLSYNKPEGGEANRKVSLGLLKGSVFSHLAHNDGTSDFRVKTPSGVAAARGTDWVVGYSGTKAKAWTLADTVLVILPSGKVVSVDVLFGYLFGEANSVRFKQPEFERLLDDLKAAGCSITLQNVNVTGTPPFPGTHTDGYIVTYSHSAEVGDGFSFFIPIRIGDWDSNFPKRPLDREPFRSNEFPVVPNASP